MSRSTERCGPSARGCWRPIATPPLFKVLYGWGLRRTEASKLDVVDFGRNPAAPEFGRYGMLNVGYAEAGPANGPVVMLLHGWPYDIQSYADAAPLLTAKGYRVIVPYLRGYGTTRFRSSDTPRNGQQSALAVDIISLMDALQIKRAIVGGFDWGSRTAAIMGALWPERCRKRNTHGARAWACVPSKKYSCT